MIVSSQPTPVAIPQEAHAFAAEQRVAPYLAAVVEMTARTFPDALRLAVLVEEDPEIPNDPHLVIEVDLTHVTPEQYVERDEQWGHELFQVCPAPLSCVFRLRMSIINP